MGTGRASPGLSFCSAELVSSEEDGEDPAFEKELLCVDAETRRLAGGCRKDGMVVVRQSLAIIEGAERGCGADSKDEAFLNGTLALLRLTSNTRHHMLVLGEEGSVPEEESLHYGLKGRMWLGSRTHEVSWWVRDIVGMIGSTWDVTGLYGETYRRRDE